MTIADHDAIALLGDLVSTPSVSGAEHEAVLLLVQRMEALGYRTRIDEAGNAVGTIGSDEPDAAEIMLLGHIDTVPGHIPVRIEDGALWGRGSVDAKGPLCAFTVAAASAELPDHTRIIVIGAVGEETPTSPGASLVRGRYRPNACLIGEPSGWQRFAIGYKGRLLVHARFTQDCGHTAGPIGSVAERGLAWHRALVANLQEWNLGHDDQFDTIQPNLQRFNTTSDGLQDSATLTVGLRLPTWIDPLDLERDIRSISRDGELEFEGHSPAYRGPRSSEPANALSHAIGVLDGRPTPTVKTGTSDMNTVAHAFGCPIVAYGPGDSTLDHTPHERLDLSEYLRSIEVLRTAIPMLANDLSGRPELSATAPSVVS
ncbi:MAG: [LysW]-lysine hydrolase [Phycisphaerales bacterium]|nr:[LysW]-lysine hydrolase [Phycisphaerales bacterium]